MSKKNQKSKKVKHGIHTWLDQGRINPSVRGYRKLQKHLEDIEAQLQDMQGGKVTAAKQILIKSTIEAYGVILLASVYCKDAGILRPDKKKNGVIELQPVLGKQFLAFMNTIRQNLIALGLDKKEAEKILTIEELAKKVEKEEQGSVDEEKGNK